MSKDKERCETMEDGSYVCKWFSDSHEVPEVRSQVEFAVDPNTCRPQIKGQIIADGDEKKVKARIDAQIKACKQGLV
jgi:hypothetical protein